MELFKKYFKFFKKGETIPPWLETIRAYRYNQRGFPERFVHKPEDFQFGSNCLVVVRNKTAHVWVMGYCFLYSALKADRITIIGGNNTTVTMVHVNMGYVVGLLNFVWNLMFNSAN